MSRGDLSQNKRLSLAQNARTTRMLEESRLEISLPKRKVILVQRLQKKYE